MYEGAIDACRSTLKFLPWVAQVDPWRNREYARKPTGIHGARVTLLVTHGNSLSIYFKNKKILKKIGNDLKKNRIIVNYNYPKPYDNFLNITTSSKLNLKKFFKIFDKNDIN